MRADGQKPHRRLGPRAGQYQMTKSARYRGSGNCGGGAQQVHVLMRRGLPGLALSCWIHSTSRTTGSLSPGAPGGWRSVRASPYPDRHLLVLGMTPSNDSAQRRLTRSAFCATMKRSGMHKRRIELDVRWSALLCDIVTGYSHSSGDYAVHIAIECFPPSMMCRLLSRAQCDRSAIRPLHRKSHTYRHRASILQVSRWLE